MNLKLLLSGGVKATNMILRKSQSCSTISYDIETIHMMDKSCRAISKMTAESLKVAPSFNQVTR